MKKYPTILALCLVVAACSSDAPVEQIRVFNDAFLAANAAAQPLIDDLALAERHVGRTTAEARAKGEQPPAIVVAATDGVGCTQAQARWQDVTPDIGFIRGLCLADARYFATVGDPPGTRAYRDAMDVVQRYAEVLLLLAEGRNIAEVQAQIQTLAGNVAALAAFVPGAQPFAAGIGPVVTQLEPLIAAAAQAQNDKEVRRLLTEGAPKVTALIDALKDGTGAMFLTLTDAAAAHALSPEGQDNPALAQADIVRIEAYRVGLSNYVVLLDELKAALNEAVVAANAPRADISLAALAEKSSRLRAQAEVARRIWSALRAGLPPTN